MRVLPSFIKKFVYICRENRYRLKTEIRKPGNSREQPGYTQKQQLHASHSSEKNTNKVPLDWRWLK